MRISNHSNLSILLKIIDKKKQKNAGDNKFYWFHFKAVQRLSSFLLLLLFKNSKDTITLIWCADFIFMIKKNNRRSNEFGEKQSKNRCKRETKYDRNSKVNTPKKKNTQRVQNKPQNHGNWSPKLDCPVNWYNWNESQNYAYISKRFSILIAVQRMRNGARLLFEPNEWPCVCIIFRNKRFLEETAKEISTHN